MIRSALPMFGFIINDLNDYKDFTSRTIPVIIARQIIQTITNLNHLFFILPVSDVKLPPV
jgi:hypothetical protein